MSTPDKRLLSESSRIPHHQYESGGIRLKGPKVPLTFDPLGTAGRRRPPTAPSLKAVHEDVRLSCHIDFSQAALGPAVEGGTLKMELELTLEQASEASVYLRAMAGAVEVANFADDVESRHLWSAAYFDNQAKLQRLIPRVGSTWRMERPYGLVNCQSSDTRPRIAPSGPAQDLVLSRSVLS